MITFIAGAIIVCIFSVGFVAVKEIDRVLTETCELNDSWDDNSPQK